MQLPTACCSLRGAHERLWKSRTHRKVGELDCLYGWHSIQQNERLGISLCYRLMSDSGLDRINDKLAKAHALLDGENLRLLIEIGRECPD